MKLVSGQINIANPGKSHQSFEVGEGTFYPGTDAVLSPIPFFLPGGEMGAVTAPLVQHTV